MLQFNRWQIGSIVVLILLGFYFSTPNFFSKENTPTGFAQTRVTLGLDLQGGSYLLLEVDTEKVLEDRVAGLQVDVRRQLRRGEGGRIPFGTIDISDRSLVVPITDPANMDQAYKRLRELSRPLGGIAIGGAAGRDWRVTRDNEASKITILMTSDAEEFFSNNAVVDSIEVVRRRIDSLGTTEPSIQRQGLNRLVVQVPGEGDSEGLQAVINRTGRLTFHMVDETADPNAPTPPRRLRLTTTDGVPLIIMETPDVTGDMVTDASATPDNDNGGFQVNFAFDGRGAKRFREITTTNVGKRFAIVLDEEIISAPNIISPITGGSGRITGGFPPQEAQELAVLIRSGALPAPLTTIEQRTVGPDLGADSVKAGAEALILGFIAVVLYILFTYGRFGIYAGIALIVNIVLIAGALSLLGATLTLPGIAGIVLTIGMAVDANVLIFERIREELDNGKPPVQAVEQGYRHAWSAIFDANLTTLIAAMIMFQLGSGPVRGFAVTLGIGVITSVFTAFVVTRVLAGRYVLGARPKTLSL